MKNNIGRAAVAIVLVGVLGTMIAGLAGAFPTGNSKAASDTAAASTAQVEKKTIEQTVTGPGEVKGDYSEKLSMPKYSGFDSESIPLNTRIPAGTTLVNTTYGTPLVAPYDLIVTEKNLPKKKYDALTEDHYLQVTRVDKMSVELPVHESDISKISVGQSVTLTYGDSSEEVTGEVSNINQVGTYNAAGSKYTVTVKVPNEEGKILVGMTANLKIKVAQAEDVLSVPVSAVETKDGESSVTVQKQDGTTEKRTVTCGLSDGKDVEIKEGNLKEGEKVILHEVGSSTSAPASSGDASEKDASKADDASASSNG